MRVLIVTSLFPNPYQPNLGVFNRRQFAALGMLCESAVIAPVPWTIEAAARLRGQGMMPRGRRTLLDGLPVEHPRYVFPPRMLRRTYGACFRRAIGPSFGRAVREFLPDIVLAAWAYPDAWATVQLARAAGLPCVVKVHGSDVLTVAPRTRRWRRTLEALHQAEAVIAVSADIVARLAAAGIPRRKLHLVYNGVDARMFHPAPRDTARARLGLTSAGPMLLFVGNLYPVKGAAVLLDACSLLRQRGVAFTCYLVGEGPLRTRLEKQTAALQLGAAVHFLGPRPHEQIADYLRAADLLVLPSLSEGVPNILLEAAACGTRFVASRVGGVPEIAPFGCGDLVAPHDPQALAAAIAAALETPCAPVSLSHPRSHADAARELAAVLTACAQRAPQPAEVAP